MKFLHFFSFFWGAFSSSLGIRIRIQATKINEDPDPKLWWRIWSACLRRWQTLWRGGEWRCGPRPPALRSPPLWSQRGVLPPCEQPHFSINDFLDFFFYVLYSIQHYFICRHSDSTVSEDDGIKLRTVATSALAVVRSNHKARSHLFFNKWNCLRQCGKVADPDPHYFGKLDPDPD